MTRLSIEEIYSAALTAGFTPEQATTWTAIALAESGGDPGAVNPVNEHSVGLWQINIDPSVRDNVWGDLKDPGINAAAAYEISHQGTDMRPWTTTHGYSDAAYLEHLDQVEAVTGYQGDDRGVGGYDSALPDALPSSSADVGAADVPPDSSYDDIDAGAPPGAQRDSDGDGLTDAFERLVGTSLHDADSDSDGLSDAHEVAVTHSNPLSADSDHDRLSDSTEAALGTSPSAWDSDNDGMSDRVEVRYGSDPLTADAGDGTAPPADPATVETTAVAPDTTRVLPASTTSGDDGSTTRLDRFVEAALAQQGDSYVFGAASTIGDPDPDTFDCSELTVWAAEQAGVTIPDGAMYQYLELKQQGELMSVEEALHTRGALLFWFSEEPVPGGLRPSSAHVAISLGNGKTIEARNSDDDVGIFDASDIDFNYAGMIPQMSVPADPFPGGSSTSSEQSVSTGSEQDATDSYYDQIDLGVDPDVPRDTDHDGLSDAFERLAGMNIRSADSDGDGLDDAYEAIRSHTDPLSSDTDDDGESDAAEVEAGTDAGALPGIAGVSGQGRFAELVRDGVRDADHDGLSNRTERILGLDAQQADSDSDGVSDSTEVSLGTDPLQGDTDADGYSDAFELQYGMDPLVQGAGEGSLGTGIPDDDGDLSPLSVEGADTADDLG